MAKPKKHLGQNFLRDEKILNKIIEAANLRSDDLVLEVGPGEGVLTKELVKRAKKVIAVELDEELARKLTNKFKDKNNLEIINNDILKINLPELVENIKLPPSPVRSTGHPLPKGEEDKEENLYKVVANIPYYITSPIIQLFLETAYPPKEMLLMVQKEVGERICAKPGKMSILAVAVQYYADPELLFTVPRAAFYPVPEVDSAVIKIEVRSKKKEISEEEVRAFFKTVKAGFAAKRKTLANNLANSLYLNKKEVEETLQKMEFNPNIRAQELSVEDWKTISSKLKMKN